MSFWETASQLPILSMVFLFVALLIAFGFEFINGFHDTANAVTTVIYTRSMKPNHAVVYSGFLNFLGVLLGGTGLAFGIVNLLPVEKLVDSSPQLALVMVIAMLSASVIWNLGTWYVGLPVSSSHTLIGSIIGVGIAHGLISSGDLSGVRWDKATDTGLALLLSPVVGFVSAGGLLLLMKYLIRQPRLYEPPVDGDVPPGWIKWAIRLTCGGVSFFHGSNDGQKGMGLLMLVLIGFMPSLYALHPNEKSVAPAKVLEAAHAIRDRLPEADMEKLRSDAAKKEKPNDFEVLDAKLIGLSSFSELPADDRWLVRQSITRLSKLKMTDAKDATKQVSAGTKAEIKMLDSAIQFVPVWVVVMTALCLGIGTMIGYKRIVVTVAEKIGKTHLTYAQGMTAELIAAITICLATYYKLPVSTTHVLSSGVAGTMAANKSGIQSATVKKIALAWILTLPICMALAGGIFAIGYLLTK
ncbi:MAG: inorganic phosphate transporter [Pirellula sp.]|jgi:phosphate/sulfate permease|nr:inorganic phosphate transporter [Pirellula sp.]